MSIYLDDNKKSHCLGCEACVQICGKAAITMEEDQDGFRYPLIDASKCIDCGMCRNHAEALQSFRWQLLRI